MVKMNNLRDIFKQENKDKYINAIFINDTTITAVEWRSSHHNMKWLERVAKKDSKESKITRYNVLLWIFPWIIFSRSKKIDLNLSKYRQNQIKNILEYESLERQIR